MTGRIYGTGELKSAKSAFLRRFAAGGATSGINYLSDALTPRAGRLGRSGASRLTGTMLIGAASAIGHDPRRGCETGVRDNDWMGTRTAYGYQYGGTQAGQEKSEYSVGGFFKETLIGAVTGGLASTAFYGANKVVQALVGSIRSNKGSSGTSPSVQINGNSYDINKLQKTQPYTYPENVSSIKETIAQNGPKSVPPIEIRVHNGQVLVVDGHHRLEAFRQLGYDRVPIKYLHSSQLGKTLSDGTYYRSIQELLDAAGISN
ncbi:MAG: ParB N-terminal domain-containing protein [Lachnospiraceae bacterium]|nr:ParB N-terminal domain-containing protein [Lachnospiraceae bacterium]